MKAKAVPVPMPAPSAPVHPFDACYGTDTGGLIRGEALATGREADKWITAYYAVAPSILDQMIDLWQASHPPLAIDCYTLLDIGAGKGRAMLTAAQHPFRQILGMELNPGLAAIARSNIATFSSSPRSRALAPITLIEGDALELPLPNTPTAIFMFHPFEAPMLRRFLARLMHHFATKSGHLDVLYVNAEHTDLLDRNPAFTNLFRGMVPMSAEDHHADLAEIANQTEYGSTGDEFCSIYRYTGP